MLYITISTSGKNFNAHPDGLYKTDTELKQISLAYFLISAAFTAMYLQIQQLLGLFIGNFHTSNKNIKAFVQMTILTHESDYLTRPVTGTG